MLTGDLHVHIHRADGERHAAPVTGPETAVGGLVVEVERSDAGISWAVRNERDHPVALDSVRLVLRLGRCGSWPRMLCNGYSSWSATATRFLGVDSDPSRHPRSLEFLRTIHHADPRPTDARELRSEMVTVIDPDDGGPTVLVGFVGGATHEGTVRAVRTDRDVELRIEAWLGGAQLPSGARRALHDIVSDTGPDPSSLLERWAGRVGAHEAARIDQEFQVGWCSWYHYFHAIDEHALRANLDRAADWPFDVFQLDDGYQSEIGDWLVTNDKFPSDLASIAEAIAAGGARPGIWLAPFLAAPASRLAHDRPDLLARDATRDDPLVGMVHETWGGLMWELDTTNPDALAHLESTAAELRSMGFSYLKLDFTFSPTFAGRYHDPTRTPAERVRAGYEAVRRGAGDDAFILACGCPLGSVVGVVDAMRIGPDVAPSWEWAPHDTLWPGYEAAAPSTRHAWNSTLLRSFTHRNLWLNDPDCLMLRRSETAMSADQIQAWSWAVGQSGGLALVSDDLALLGSAERALLDDVVALGRRADDDARAGRAPQCLDLLTPGGPTQLRAAGHTLTADPADPHPALEVTP